MPSYNLTIPPQGEVLPIEKIHLSKENRMVLTQLLEEFTYYNALKEFNLPIDNKILLHGHTGCGKTATARAIAKALNKNIIILNLSGFVSARLGETAKNVANVFSQATYGKAVLFLDEFDLVGKARNYQELSSSSGEMRRLVNTIIQLIDGLPNETLLIGATNFIDSIDTALLRRFQLKLKFELPTKAALDEYYEELLDQYPKQFRNVERQYDISYAEAKDLTLRAIKSQIIKAEKQRELEQKHLLFSYGTLQSEQVQAATYGRRLKGKKDFLQGYKLEELEITDKTVLATSGKKMHPIAIKTENPEDQIEGTIFEITQQELLETDKYEVVDYKRVLGVSASGKEAWVYVSKNQ
ncbi:MAG: AAA family ATPase [Chitinophagales bacterium]|nr:AAA family ATPase [Chitinophagales bacterium]